MKCWKNPLQRTIEKELSKIRKDIKVNSIPTKDGKKLKENRMNEREIIKY